jgi:hypothetical protein
MCRYAVLKLRGESLKLGLAALKATYVIPVTARSEALVSSAHGPLSGRSLLPTEPIIRRHHKKSQVLKNKRVKEGRVDISS